MYISIPVLTILGIGGYAFMKQSKFGKAPSGERKNKVENSPNYRNGQFQNLSDTPSFTEGANYFTVLKKFLFEKDKRSTPSKEIPTIKTDLQNLNPQEEVLVWFGHSSYFFQVDGKKILVDPVFSGHASPVAFSARAFKGTNNYKAEDIPEIDILFLTHDHWDHLDYDTIMKIKPKIKKIITGLGTGEHLEAWGFNPAIITEKDWNEEVILEDGIKVNTAPARHFSGRGFKRNGVLWTSFVLQTPSYKMFLGGDSGYDDHFKEIGKKFGPFDLALLENGQYNRHWKYIHMMPEETLQAAKDLRTKRLLPVHNSKFALANHSWDAPLKTISTLHRNDYFQLLTPRIGEKVYLKSDDQNFTKWWEELN
ncbi:MBL fold metallo-hydrolase [Salinimicrobium marinum]|uniref:MBL fold metallo-hydrolase n=1 Tax=Salinimicrobium marinum TaxID=680283 RepID=A0A918VVK9_9FLAO|nr:MBL fold metallo-hydrolase [Salinimicrobium marinum]GHA33465.1 MBL fold metallo-hydrolase [Salinimicrobium marinum]